MVWTFLSKGMGGRPTGTGRGTAAGRERGVFRRGRGREVHGFAVRDAPASIMAVSLPARQGEKNSQGFTLIQLSPSNALDTKPSTSRAASAFRTSSKLGRVAGCRGVNTVQQSS